MHHVGYKKGDGGDNTMVVSALEQSGIVRRRNKVDQLGMPDPVVRAREIVSGIEGRLKATENPDYDDQAALRTAALGRARIVLERLNVTADQVIASFAALEADSKTPTLGQEKPTI